MKFKAGTTLVMLMATAVFGLGHMVLDVLDLGLAKKTTHLTLMLTTSGGLLPTSDVTMRGVKVGRVVGVHATTSGLAVSLELDGEHPVPTNSAISIEALSVVGEQYIDFKPRLLEPPYFADGGTIPVGEVTPPVTVSDALARSNALIAALDPQDLQIIAKNIADALIGNDAALDTLATGASLYAQTVRENKRLIDTFFGNIAPLAAGLKNVQAGSQLSGAASELPYTSVGATRLLIAHRGIGEFGADNDFGPDSAIQTLIGKLDEYFDNLSGPLSAFAPVLEAATEPVRDTQFDAGTWLDFYSSTLAPEGAVRVRVQTPQ